MEAYSSLSHALCSFVYLPCRRVVYGPRDAYHTTNLSRCDYDWLPHRELWPIPRVGQERVRTSGQGVALIKKFEGCELEAYQCSANVWTIGYGHTRGVKEGDEISADKAEYILLEDLIEFEKYVDQLVTVSLNQDQFDALVAWTFNLGPTNLKKSTMLLRLNDGQYNEVPAEMARWNRSGGEVLEGLKRRRKAEGLLFQGLDWQDV